MTNAERINLESIQLMADNVRKDINVSKQIIEDTEKERALVIDERDTTRENMKENLRLIERDLEVQIDADAEVKIEELDKRRSTAQELHDKFDISKPYTPKVFDNPNDRHPIDAIPVQQSAPQPAAVEVTPTVAPSNDSPIKDETTSTKVLPQTSPDDEREPQEELGINKAKVVEQKEKQPKKDRMGLLKRYFSPFAFFAGLIGLIMMLAITIQWSINRPGAPWVVLIALIIVVTFVAAEIGKWLDTRIAEKRKTKDDKAHKPKSTEA